MTAEEAEVLMQCHCPGLPGTEDPRIVKAVKTAEKDPALATELTRQRAFDERQLAAVEQVMLPPELLGRLLAGPETVGRAMSAKGAQPLIISVVFGAAVLLGWGGVSLWNKAHSFPGKDSAVRMVEVNEEMTGMEMEPRKGPAAALNDWFFDKYGFEDYFVPASFENSQTVGARLFKQDGQPVAQVAVEDHNMIFYSFKAEDFGVTLPQDKWRVFSDGDWVAAITQHDDECFMVAFRGQDSEMNGLLKGK